MIQKRSEKHVQSPRQKLCNTMEYKKCMQKKHLRLHKRKLAAKSNLRRREEREKPPNLMTHPRLLENILILVDKLRKQWNEVVSFCKRPQECWKKLIDCQRSRKKISRWLDTLTGELIYQKQQRHTLDWSLRLHWGTQLSIV